MTLAFPKPTKAPKKRRTAAESAYLGRVKMLGCAVCGCIPCDAHHVICGRYSGAKTPDWHAVALCDRHHQGLWDIRGPAIHKQRLEWVEWFGPDTDYIAETQARVLAEWPETEIPAEYLIRTDLEGER